MDFVNTTFAYIGQTEMLIIAGVALLLFGGAKLPELAKGLGQGIREFKGAMSDETPSNTPTPGPAANTVVEEPTTKTTTDAR